MRDDSRREGHVGAEERTTGGSGPSPWLLPAQAGPDPGPWASTRPLPPRASTKGERAGE